MNMVMFLRSGKNHKILLIIALLVLSIFAVSHPKNENTINKNAVQPNLPALKSFSTGFIENVGQKASHIDYYIETKDLLIGFSTSQIQYVFSSDSQLQSVTVSFPGSNQVVPTTSKIMDLKTSYFIGNDSSTWNVAQHASSLIYPSIYHNIDLHYMMDNGKLKYEFYVYPGGNPKDIQIQWNGDVSLQSQEKGIQILPNLPSQSGIIDSNPVNYQPQLQNKKVGGQFTTVRNNIYGFTLDRYDTSKLLIIDPYLLLSSTYIGGSLSDQLNSMVLDSSDNIYVAGSTQSSDFPTTPGAYDQVGDGNPYGPTLPISDIFISKLSPDGSTLLASTYIGGSSGDYSYDLAIDSSGNLYVTGYTISSNFPTTTNAYDTTKNSNDDIVVCKLAANFTTLFLSTYLGGSGNDDGYGIALDSSNNIYITGDTKSLDYPTTTGAYDTSGSGTSTQTDLFITKLAANGTTLMYSTYVSGSSYDVANSITVDSAGNAYITGNTISPDFPITVNAYKKTITATIDSFVTKLAANGSTLIFSTFLSIDDGYNIQVDNNGDVYVVGNTYGISYEYFRVSKLAANGSKILASKTIAAGDHSYGRGLFIDSSGYVYVAGQTIGNSYPTTADAIDSTGVTGTYDAFLTKLTANLTNIIYSTYLGGNNSDVINKVQVNSLGNIVVAGATNSVDFPTVTGSYNTTGDGNSTKYDGFISIIGNNSVLPQLSSPSDFSYEFTSTSNTITWNYNSKHTANYNITVDGILFGGLNTTIINGSNIVYIDGLSLGSHVVTIKILDNGGYQLSDSVVVSVVDTRFPLVGFIGGFQYELGSTGNSLTWYPSDASPDSYSVYRNGTLIDSNSYTNATTVSISLDGLTLGTYNFTILVNDTSGNQVSDTVFVSIVDTTSPDLNTINDVQFEFGSTGYVLTWDPRDSSPGSYLVYQDGVNIESNPYTNTTIVNISLDGLSAGTYNYTIVANDTSGNLISDTVIVTVYVADLISPDLSSPNDIQYVEGSTGNSIIWNVGDQYPNVYNITMNGTLYLDTTIWVNGSISLNVDGLSVGTYVFVINVFDGYGNFASDEVTVTVSSLITSVPTTSQRPTLGTSISNSIGPRPTQSSSSETSTTKSNGGSQLLFFANWMIFGLVSLVFIKRIKKS